VSAVAAPTGLTVLIPAYDEEESIGSTVAAVREAFAGLPHDLEILVVDDGSADRTAACAEAAGARVLRHPHRSGYGRSLKTGILAARHETIAISDGDGSYPVEELPRMLELARDHDLVIGARSGPEYRGTLLRSPLRAGFVLLASFVAGQWIPDPNSGLRVFRRAEVVPLFPDLPRGFSFTTTQTLIMTLAGAFIHYRPIDYRPRIGKSKILPLRHSLQISQGLVEVVLRHNPLKLFLLVGLVPLAAIPPAAVCAGAGTRLLAVALLACTAMIVFALGMLAAVALRRPPGMPR
jgi:polyisoprenyl-phosphate glycosyltransferase